VRRALPLALLAVLPPAPAQDAGVQRQLIQRQQQSDAFALQLRQSQEALRVAPGDLKARQSMDARQLSERQRLDNLGEKQLLEVQPNASHAPPALRAYERDKASAERLPFRSPIVELPPQPAPPPAKLEPSLKGAVDVIDAPR
jgi:hypothetical protein